MSNNRKLAMIAILILGAAALFWSLNTASAPILVSSVKAVKMNANMYSVYLNMQNDGDPDFITDIQSTDQHHAHVMGAHPTYGIAIPNGASPSFSSDGAHIMVSAEGTELNAGEFIPLTINFKNSKSQQIKAIVQDPPSSNTMAMGDENAPMDHSMHGSAKIEVGANDNAPAIEMKVTQNSDETWAIKISTQNFEFFEPQTEPMMHKDGQGHGHLYLNGLKLQRMYSNTATIGKLPQGQHEITVTLNSNDHKAYAINGEPVSASSEITAD